MRVLDLRPRTRGNQEGPSARAGAHGPGAPAKTGLDRMNFLMALRGSWTVIYKNIFGRFDFISLYRGVVFVGSGQASLGLECFTGSGLGTRC